MMNSAGVKIYCLVDITPYVLYDPNEPYGFFIES